MENPTLETVQTLVTLVAVLTLSIIALGTAGLTGLYLTLRQNGRLLEQIYQKASPDTQQWLRELVLAVKAGVELAADLTDGDPTTPHNEQNAPGRTLSVHRDAGKRKE